MLKHHLIRRSAVFLATAAALLLATAAAANASVGPNVVTIGSGEGGYYAVSGNGFDNVGFTETPLEAATNIGAIHQGGISGQLCDPNTGEAIQAGLIANPDMKTFTVEYAHGILSGANVDNCVGNPLLTGPVALHASTLSGVAISDAVQVFISFQNHKSLVRHPGHWTSCKRHGKEVAHCHWHKAYFTVVHSGEGKVQAFDTTSGTEVYSSGWFAMNPDYAMDNAGVGIQQDTQLVSAGTVGNPTNHVTCPTTATTVPAGIDPTSDYNGICGPTGTGAGNDVVHFSQVFVNGFGLGDPDFQTLGGTYTAFQVATAADGNKANPALVAPNNSATSNVTAFDVYAGNPVG